MSEQGHAQQPAPASSGKSRTTAALLALFLGTVGAQWFYLDRGGRARWCLVFCWTGVPTLLGVRDAYRFSTVDDGTFESHLANRWGAGRPWSDGHWRRLRSYATALFGTFLLGLILVPSDGEANFADEPIATLVLFGFVILWFAGFLVLPYLIERDRRAVAAHLADVDSPGWLSAGKTLLLTWVTLCVYPGWYLYRRTQRVRSFLDGGRTAATGTGSAATATQAATAPGGHSPAANTPGQSPPAGGQPVNRGTADGGQGAPGATAGRTPQRDPLRSRIASLRDRLDDAEGSLDRGELDAAADKLAATAERIEDARATARRQGFANLVSEVDDVDERCETLREHVADRRQSEGPPESIPGHPDLAVTYADLFDEEPIGSGGNADVTRARHPGPDGDLTLAIKTPRLTGTVHSETVERLLAEAETWAKLDDHDHVVGVVDYGSEPLPWIAMEYMDGGHLGPRAGEMPFQQAVWTALGITRAVRHAHRHGVAHLDLKPENVLFRTVAGAWDVPKVGDWGLSKHLLDHSNSVEGLTPNYAAPEQFDEEYGAVDDVTDVYQLGAVCYELFTGRPPFEGDATRVMRAVLEEEPTPPSEVSPEVPPALDDVLLTALAKEKADRYDSVVYVRDALADLSRVE